MFPVLSHKYTSCFTRRDGEYRQAMLSNLFTMPLTNLRRLIVVYEQLREGRSAVRFLNAYRKVASEDPWSVETRARYQLIGVR